MGLRLKAFLVLGVVMVALFFGINQVLSRSLLSDFVSFERYEMEQDILRVKDMLRARMDDLSIKLADWSQWDDTYQFITDRNQEYIDSNLTTETFGVLRVNMIAIEDASGNALYERYVVNGQDKPFPEDFKEHISREAEEMSGSGRERFEEVLDISEGVVVYAIRPVTSSDGTAESNGFMMFAYVFDQASADMLGAMTRLDVAYAPLSDQVPLPDDFAEANKQLSREHPVIVPDSGSSGTVSGYILVEGGHGKPAMMLRVDEPRDIYKKGQQSIALFSKLMATASAAFIVITFFIFDWLVLRKISRLSKQVRNVRAGGDPDASVFISGKDEFAGLAREVNDMLSSLRENEAKRQQQMEEVERLNRLMVNRELKMIELKQEIRAQKNKQDDGKEG